jgi:hypothetical protein
MRQFGTVFGAGIGTVVIMSGASFAVTAVAVGVTKRVLKLRKVTPTLLFSTKLPVVTEPCRHCTVVLQSTSATACSVCTGTGYLACKVCHGKGFIRCRAPVSLRTLAAKVKPGPKAPEAEPVLVNCPACGTTLRQRCLNCLGEGTVFSV